MSRLESIKEQLSNLGAGKVVKYDNTMNLATQYALDYKNDTEYLLQRLERYENALLKYSDMIVVDSEDRPHDVGMVAREALKEEGR